MVSNANLYTPARLGCKGVEMETCYLSQERWNGEAYHQPIILPIHADRAAKPIKNNPPVTSWSVNSLSQSKMFRVLLSMDFDFGPVLWALFGYVFAVIWRKMGKVKG